MKTLKARKLLLSEFSDDPKFCKAVREIVRNTIKKNIRLSDRDKIKLKRYKKVILALAKRKSHEKTKALMQQSGTGIFLPIVIPLVASVLGELLTRK